MKGRQREMHINIYIYIFLPGISIQEYIEFGISGLGGSDKPRRFGV